MNKKIKFIERIKILKHFSKVNENTWLVQSNKNSLCEAFYVTVIPSGIIMTGDYGGVMLMPYGSKDLINWMANATDIGYFCQKVSMANQYHKVKDWEPERALEDIRKEFENDWENYREKLKYY